MDTIQKTASYEPLMKADKRRALAVTSKERRRGFPNVPTVAETPVPDDDVVSWLLHLTGRLVVAIRDRLYEAFKRAMAQPDFSRRLQARVEADMARWRPLAGVVSQS